MLLGENPVDPPTNRLSVRTDRDQGSFDKRHLLPLGETPLLGLGRARYQAGDTPRALSVAGGIASPLICWEGAVPSARREITGGWVPLVSHDAWLPPRLAEAHLAQARLVAVESGRWVVRAASSGPSAVVRGDGAIVWRTRWVDGDVESTPGVAHVAPIVVDPTPWNGAWSTPWAAIAAALGAIAHSAHLDRMTRLFGTSKPAQVDRPTPGFIHNLKTFFGMWFARRSTAEVD